MPRDESFLSNQAAAFKKATYKSLISDFKTGDTYGRNVRTEDYTGTEKQVL